jgi:glycosyltransferase involved in cell wall biosynthesis
VRAVLFGTFNSRHAANILLAEELRASGAEVRVCHEPLWEKTRDKQDSYFALSALLALGFHWVMAACRLALRFRYAAAGAEVIVVGFNGQLDVLLARLLAGGRRIVFVPLVTISETLVEDRKVYPPGSVLARLFQELDRWTLMAADLVVMDTRAHAEYLVAELGVPADKIRVHYLGAEVGFAPEATPTSRPLEWQPGPRLRVLAYSSYLPLHGMEVVAAAAAELRPEEGIAFLIVGAGPERGRLEAQFNSLPHVTLEDWMPQEELVRQLWVSDVSLGIFGTSAKAQMVIPNKVYQAAQAGCPVVSLDTPAIREIFVPGESLITVTASGIALAASLRSLAEDLTVGRRIADAAKAAVSRAAGPGVRAARWRETLGFSAQDEPAPV